MLKNGCRSTITGFISILFVVGIFATPGLALEGKAGEVIKTVEELKELQAKGLIYEGVVLVYRELIEKFGYSIPIVTRTDRTQAISNAYRRSTEINKGKAGIGPNGELLNYGGAGLPFPGLTPDDPQAGTKAAWNFDLRCRGDDGSYTFSQVLTDSKGFVKYIEGEAGFINFTFRTDLDPKPNLEGKNPEGIWRREFVYMEKPFSSKGLSQLSTFFVDTTKYNDIWVYVPGLRRNVRIGGANRCDCLGGLLTNMEEYSIWSGACVRYNWKLLEVRDLLVPTLQPFDKPFQLVKGAHWFGIILERRKMWIIEQTPKPTGSDYCYSKKIFLLDPESWYYTTSFSYDSAGRLWKVQEENYALVPLTEAQGGGATFTLRSGDTMDYRIMESQSYPVKVNVNTGLKADFFTLENMRKRGR